MQIKTNTHFRLNRISRNINVCVNKKKLYLAFSGHEKLFYGTFYTSTHSKISTESNNTKLYICIKLHGEELYIIIASSLVYSIIRVLFSYP